MAYAAGQPLNASDLNVIAAQYYNTSVQTGIVTSTNTRLDIPTNAYNYGGQITRSGNILTINKSGLYYIAFGFEMESATGVLYGWAGHGTNTGLQDKYVTSNHSNRNGIDTLTGSDDHLFTAGDTLALWVWHNKGSNSQTLLSDIRPFLTVRYIGQG